jgi:hypothetical protein
MNYVSFRGAVDMQSGVRKTRAGICFGSLLCAMTGLLIAASPALAQKGPRHPTAPIPFEQERARERGDRGMLLLNEDASRIPAHRILELPIINGKMGEHAKLDDNVEIFFPFGRIVTSTIEFHKYRPVGAKTEGMGPEFLPDPRYNRVKNFDRALGAVCASERIDGGPFKLELRRSPDNSLSLVRSMPAAEKPATDEDAVSYRVVSAMEIRFLARQEPDAERLFRRCQQNADSQRVSQKN